MANKALQSSSGYFNKEMRDILKRGEKKTTAPKKKSGSKKKK